MNRKKISTVPRFVMFHGERMSIVLFIKLSFYIYVRLINYEVLRNCSFIDL